MATISCKMCGANLPLTEGASVVECEFCGVRQTVPTADNEKKMALFGRANRLRFACEFDKAAGVYESIVAEFPTESEAYWGLVLCKYGIEYVDDPATGIKIPTCHRTSFESVMDDENFEQAQENADVLARKVYREEAKQIEELRKGIIEISGKEAPYDIFICYKEKAEDGGRTLDSVLAHDVYGELTEKGYRVFFSRISLEDKLGQEYEPYIFAALNSAKVMLAFGTSYENYNAVWVKNEWSRFLQLIAKGEKKTLIPCYKDIDAYDMPKEFVKLQAQDMGKVGANQDLIRGIEKIIPKKSTSSKIKKTVTAEVTADTLLERAYILLRDGEYNQAGNYFEKVLDRSPKDSKAYWGKLLSLEKCVDNTEFTGQHKITEYFQRLLSVKNALDYSDEELVNGLKRLWGDAYNNACKYALDDEKKVFEACFEKVKLAILNMLHNEQSKQREEINKIELEKKKEAELLHQRLERENKEKEMARLAEIRSKRNHFIKQLICYLLIFSIEITFFSLMLTFKFRDIINASLGGFIGINFSLIANVIIIGVVDIIGKIKYGTYLAAGVSCFFSIWIFIEEMSQMEGIILSVLGFFFFGAIEAGVIGLCSIIADKISTVQNE